MEKYIENKKPSLEEQLKEIKETIKELNISDLVIQLRHHVGHFLLGSRAGNEYYIEQLEKIRIVLDEFLSRDISEDIKLELNKLNQEIDKIYQSEQVDKEILENIQTISHEIKNIKEKRDQ